MTSDWVANMKTHASEHPVDAIFATMHPAPLRHRMDQLFGEWDHRVDFVVSNDFFKTHRILVPRGNRFLFSERYLSIAQVRQLCSNSNAHLYRVISCFGISALFQVVDPKDRPAHVASDVVLQLSSDGGHRFHGAELEYPMMQHSYTILDTANDAVFLHVNHGGKECDAINTHSCALVLVPTFFFVLCCRAKWGNVYISNSMGTNFSLTLPNNRRDKNGAFKHKAYCFHRPFELFMLYLTVTLRYEYSLRQV